MKRGANEAGIDMQKRKEEIDDDNDDGRGRGRDSDEEEPVKVDLEEIKSRKIFKAKRPAAKPNDGTGATSSESNKPSIASANPFANLKFSTPATTTAPSTIGQPFSLKIATSKPAQSAIDSTEGGSKQLGSSISNLNSSFISFVEKQISKDPTVSLASACVEYINHFDKVIEAAGGLPATTAVASSVTETARIIPDVPSKNIFSSTTTKTETKPRDDDKEKDSSLFPKSTPAATPASNPLFGGLASSSSLFPGLPSSNGSSLGMFSQGSKPGESIFSAPSSGLFGAPPGAAAPSGLFSSNPSSSIFANLSKAPITSSKTDDGGDDGGDDGEEEGGETEEPEVKVGKAKESEDDDILIEIENVVLKNLKKDANEWAARGKGRLVLLQNKNDKNKSRIVIRAEGTGKIIFNAPIFKLMNPKVEKSTVTLFAINYKPNPTAKNGFDVENDGKPTFWRIKTDINEKANELQTKIAALL